jgi:hypothetical protein
MNASQRQPEKNMRHLWINTQPFVKLFLSPLAFVVAQPSAFSV